MYIYLERKNNSESAFCSGCNIIVSLTFYSMVLLTFASTVCVPFLAFAYRFFSACSPHGTVCLACAALVVAICSCWRLGWTTLFLRFAAWNPALSTFCFHVCGHRLFNACEVLPARGANPNKSFKRFCLALSRLRTIAVRGGVCGGGGGMCPNRIFVELFFFDACITNHTQWTLQKVTTACLSRS